VNARLRLELLHHVKEVVINLGLVLELQLDLIEEVQRALEFDAACWRRRRHHVLEKQRQHNGECGNIFNLKKHF
jgi:hypothetical protein